MLRHKKNWEKRIKLVGWDKKIVIGFTYNKEFMNKKQWKNYLPYNKKDKKKKILKSNYIKDSSPKTKVKDKNKF